MPSSQQKPPAASDSLSFVLNGEVTVVRHVAPTKMVLNFLREDLRKTGTKEGCAEGDCGACTVVLGELYGDRLAMKTVNACLQFMPTLDGKALFTVENLRQPTGTLHPVQEAMVVCHGSQCGFCTPGFVMSLWALYLAHTRQGSPPNAGADPHRSDWEPVPLHGLSSYPRRRREDVRSSHGGLRQ